MGHLGTWAPWDRVLGSFSVQLICSKQNIVYVNSEIVEAKFIHYSSFVHNDLWIMTWSPMDVIEELCVTIFQSRLGLGRIGTGFLHFHLIIACKMAKSLEGDN